MIVNLRNISIAILITLITNGCKKSPEAINYLPGKTQITPIHVNNSIIGIWKFQNVISLYDKSTFYDLGSGFVNKPGKDTFVNTNNPDFDTLALNQDNTFSATYVSYVDNCHISGKWSLLDSTLIFDDVSEVYSRNGNIYHDQLSYPYRFSNITKSGELVLTTPYIFESNDCSSTNYFFKYEIIYNRLK